MAEKKILVEQRKSLEEEYKLSYQYYHGNNILVWQTFSYVSALNVAALAFVTRTTSGSGNILQWLGGATVGLALIIILIVWSQMANRWWAYAQVAIHRMIEIETLLGMKVMTDGGWLRQPLDQEQIQKLNKEERARYFALRAAFPKFPRYGLRQQVLILFIIRSLILIWAVYLISSFFEII